MNIQDELNRAEPFFNPAINMLHVVWKGPGYHSRVPDGTTVHEVRKSIYYALALLESGREDLRDRAIGIITTVLSLQETDPYKATYGIWPWLYEEPLDKMSPPDWNWADFIGAALCHIVKEYPASLPVALRNPTSEALGHAAWSIFRRNVLPGYTNIAIMGAAVTASAGEILGEPRLVAYARSRIRTFLDYTAATGGLNEYNSPTYTFIALFESERILQLVDDAVIRADAEKLRCLIWQAVADRFHPSTTQLAGPHSRAYADRLSYNLVNYLREATGLDLKLHPAMPGEEFSYDGIRHLPCPTALLERFIRLAKAEMELHQRFVKREPDTQSFYGHTWLSEDCTLGSVNRECFWTQRRPLLAYWRTPVDPAVVLRLRFLRDGKDFSTAGLYTVQKRHRLVTGLRMFTDRGDYHIHLDRPADHCFSTASLLLRYELSGQGVTVQALDSGRFELAAGDMKAIIHTVPGYFGNNKVGWRCGHDDKSCWIEAVCYEGPKRDFVFDASFTTELFSALELIPRTESPAGVPVKNQSDGTQINLTWHDLALIYPCHAGTYD